MSEKSALRGVGLKVTVPRMRIFNMLTHAEQRHMSAEEIYQRLREESDEIGLATVYRVLTQFEFAGLVIRHRFDEGHSVFEINTQEHHDHFVCIHCNRVEEFVDDLIEQQQQRIAERLGYRITDHSLYLYGECQEIQRNGVCGKCGKVVKAATK